MIGICIDNARGYQNSLTVGKVYKLHLCDTYTDSYTFIDNGGNTKGGFKTRFKLIETKLAEVLYG